VFLKVFCVCLFSMFLFLIMFSVFYEGGKAAYLFAGPWGPRGPASPAFFLTKTN
jgi:hypothetical protein